jgi:ATP-dependent Lon protease
MDELGLFPLPVVLFPTERIPLHIFEPRYLELIEDCLANGREFGLVFAADESLQEVGTRAAVAEIMERLEDGRMNIVVEGGARFRVVEVTGGRSFTTADVEPVEDDDETPADLSRALELFTSLASEAGSDVDIPDPQSPLLDFELAARVDFTPEDKQDLLASTSPSARAERLAELLELALEAVRTEKALRERAGRNGKVTQLDDE